MFSIFGYLKAKRDTPAFQLLVDVASHISQNT